MPSAGGPAAIHGFLYQLLVHLDDVAKYAVDLNDATTIALEFEPDGGGDAMVHLPGKRIVQQIKTRARAGTWSLREIADGPITDFVRATQRLKTPGDEFHFVSDGRTGHLREFASFLDRVRRKNFNLKDPTRHTFTGAGELSDAALLEWIRDRVHVELKTKVPPSEADVLHVVARLRLDPRTAEETLAGNVLGLLRRCVPNPDDADAKLKELVGTLMSSLSNGTFQTTGREFLLKHDVDVDRIERLAQSVNALAEINGRIAANVLHYRPDRDVRPPPTWTPDKTQLLVISGRSGTGKSWRLARLAQTLAAQGSAAVLQPFEQSIPTTLDSAAKVLWNDVLRTKSIVDMPALRQALADRTDIDPGMVVLIDWTTGIQDLIPTITRLQLDPQLRIVMTMDEAQAKQAQALYPALLEVDEIVEFSVAELEALLAQGGVEPKSIPAELFSLLRLPLLANLYVSQAAANSNFLSKPESEFALFDALWLRTSSALPVAPSVLRSLARYAFAHPKQRSHLVESALPTADLALLEALQKSGWISLHNGEVAFAHARLASWAFANALVADLSAGALTPKKLHQSLSEHRRSVQVFRTLRADVLWMLGRASAQRAHSAELLALEEEASSLHLRELYSDVIPSLGVVGLEVLVQRLKLPLPDQTRFQYPEVFRRVAGRFRGRPPSVELGQLAQKLLKDNDRFVVNLGLGIVESSEQPVAIDDVWRIHLADVANMADQDWEARNHKAYSASFAALKACVLSDVDWLEKQIELAKGATELRTLAYQLNSLPHDQASEIWGRQKQRLLAKASEAPRGVLACIERFKDTSLVDFVVSSLGSAKDMDAGHAFSVLCVVDPERALTLLDSLPVAELYLWRYMWVQTLHRSRSEQTENWVRAHLNDWPTLSLFAALRTQCSAELTQSVIATFCQVAESAKDLDNPWLTSWVEALVGIPQLALIRGLANTPTEAILLHIAKRRVDPRRSWYDHLLEDARSLLRAIGGPGIQQLVEYELAQEPAPRGHDAEEDAPLAPTENTPQLVFDRGLRLTGDSDVDRFSAFYSTIILAALDADDLLFAMLDSGRMEELAQDTITIRRSAAVWPDALVAKIAGRLKQRPLSGTEFTKLCMLASVARAPSLLPDLESAVMDFAVDEKGFIRGALSVAELGEPSERFALWALSWLKPGDAGGYAAQVLTMSNSPVVQEKLLEATRELVSRPEGKLLAASVLKYFPSSKDADDLAVELFMSCPPASSIYRRAARAGDPSLPPILRRRAVEARGPMFDARYEAVKALAEVAPAEAADSALWALESQTMSSRFAIAVVVHFGTDEQCERLIRQVAILDKPVVWAALGREFRKRTNASVDNILSRIAGQESPSVRRAFAEIAGWQGERLESKIRERLDTELIGVVTEALERALACQHQLRATGQLLADLRSAKRLDRLSALQATIKCGDPFLLDDSSDPQWIGSAVEQTPYLLIYAEKELKRLRDKAKLNPWQDSGSTS